MGLGRDDDAAADVIVADVGEHDIFHDRALVLEDLHRLVDALLHLGRDACDLALVPAACQRDTHALDRAMRRGAIVDLGRMRRGLVVGVVAGQDVEHQGRVLDSPGERARCVEAE